MLNSNSTSNIMLQTDHAPSSCVLACLFHHAHRPPPQVEFPALSLTSAQGDGEGQNEMNASMDYLRKTLVAFQDQASSIRVFFPDQQELVSHLSHLLCP